MSAEKTIFADALAIASAEQRQAFLDRACGGNAALRAEVDALLAAHEQATSFLESPPPGLTSSNASPDSALDLSGTTIGHYKLLERIGEGGMGVVYMAEQLRPVKRRVALKIIKPGLDTRQVIGRFEAERQALAMMDHPSIAKVFDAGATDTGRSYFVMELVRGVPITEYCDQHHLTPRQRLELFIQVCQAVQHAHQKGIIHRDLKPNNVLVTLGDNDKPIPKVIDFGIAKATGEQRLTERTLFTEFRQLIGTPLYMSPEQAEMSQLTDVDTRSDVYSLGVLLYELLTGTTPFDKQRLAKAAYDEVRRIIREEEPPRPSTRLSTLGQTIATISAQRQTDPKKLSQTVRGELDWIVMKALEKERTRRYETANGLARDVERYLTDEPVEACPPSRTYRTRKFLRRNKAAMTTTGIVAAALIAGIAASGWEAVRARRAEHLANVQRDQAQAEKRRADQQESITHEVNQFFMRDVIGQANPGWQADASAPPDPQMTVRQALDRAAASIGDKFRDDRFIHAAIHNAIGQVYAELGVYDKAEQQLKSASDLVHDVNPQDIGETRDAILYKKGLAELYLLEWDAAKAEPLLLIASNEARSLLGEQDSLTLGVLSCLSQLYNEKRDYSKAEEICRFVLETLRRKNGEEHSDTIVMWFDLGVICEQAGNYAKAEAPLLNALNGARRVHGEQAVTTLLVEASLAHVYREMGQYEKSERFFQESIQGLRRIYGDMHPKTRAVLSQMARLYELQDRYADAEPLLREAAEWYAEHPDSRPALVPDGTPVPAIRRLIICYRKLHEFDKADEWQRRLRILVSADVQARLPDTLPADPNVAADALNHRARTYAQLGKFSQAVADWNESLRLHASTLSRATVACLILFMGEEQEYQAMRPGFLHKNTSSTQSKLLIAEASLLQAAPPDQLDIAEKWIDSAISPSTQPATDPSATTQPARRPRPPSQVQVQLVRGMLEYRRGSYSDAAQRLARCRDDISAKHATAFDRFGQLAEWRVTAIASLAMCQYELGQLSEAQRSVREAQESLASEVPTADSSEAEVGSSDWLIAHITVREASLFVTVPTATTGPSVIATPQ